MELFIKRFIDLLDELVPVTMVHTMIEQPLGAVTHDYYIRLHARLDLADEDSPFVEIELYPYTQNDVELLYAYTYPQEGINLSESEFIQKIKANNNLKLEKIVSLDESETYYYESFYEEDLTIPDENGAIDELIHTIVPKIKDLLLIGSYELAEEE